MEAIVTRVPSMMRVLTISLAFVFGGSTAFADGLTGLPSAGDPAPGLFGGFSDTDLQILDHASTAEATAARIAAFSRSSGQERKFNSRRAGLDVTRSAAEGDLFPHSGRLMPLLVVRPEADAPAVRAPTTLRPGLVQPVGVSVSSLRSATPSERSGR